MKALANDSQGRRARAISFYGACSCRLLIQPLIRSRAIWLSNSAESPNVVGPNELLSLSLIVSWSLSITFSVTRRPIWREGKPSLKNGIVKEHRNASFASSPVWAIKWNFSPSLRLGNLYFACSRGDFFRRVLMRRGSPPPMKKDRIRVGAHCRRSEPLWCCEPEEESDQGSTQAPPFVAAKPSFW